MYSGACPVATLTTVAPERVKRCDTFSRLLLTDARLTILARQLGTELLRNPFQEAISKLSTAQAPPALGEFSDWQRHRVGEGNGFG